jgi:Uma2 family endonuclease
MATTEHAVKRTYEDYCRAPDDKRYELLNGELMMVPAPNIKHQSILLTLGSELRQFVQEHEFGEVFVAPVDVVLSDTDVVQPDVLFISRAREDRITDENVQGAPDLVIEILSPSTAGRDLEDKHELYGRHGVLEYWIIDPVAETVAVHRQRDGKLERSGLFVGRGETWQRPCSSGKHMARRLVSVSETRTTWSAAPAAGRPGLRTPRARCPRSSSTPRSAGCGPTA